MIFDVGGKGAGALAESLRNGLAVKLGTLLDGVDDVGEVVAACGGLAYKLAAGGEDVVDVNEDNALFLSDLAAPGVIAVIEALKFVAIPAVLRGR